MAGQFFSRIFGHVPQSFATITELDKFVTKKRGAPLEVKYVFPDLCTSRGSVFGIKDIGDANERFERALSK